MSLVTIKGGIHTESLDVFFSEDNELYEYEAVNKGYRLDVYVKLGNSFFQLAVYDMNRLQQDFDSELESYGFYAVDPNLILVREANKREIINTIMELFKQKYF